VPLVGACPDAPTILMVTPEKGEWELLPISPRRTHQMKNKAEKSKLHQAKINTMVHAWCPR